MTPRWRGLSLRLGLGLLAFSALLFCKNLEDAYVLPQRLGLGLSALLILLSLSKPKLPQGPLWRLALVWLAWRLLCRLLAQGPGLPAWLADQAGLWALFLAACCSLGDPASRAYFGRALGLALGLEALYGLAGALGWDPFGGSALDLGFNGRAYGSLGNPDFLGGWLALLLPLALAGALTGRAKSRGAAWVVLTAGAVALLLTQARAAWLAGLLGLGVALWRLRPGRWAWMAAAGLALVLALGLAWSFSHTGGRQRLAEAVDPRSDAWQSRLLMSQEALALAQSHPWTGVGPGLFSDGYLDLQGPRLLANRSLPYRYTEDAHNDWAQAAAESGWPGLLLWAGLFALALRAAWRQGGPGGAAVAGGLVALGVQGCFHFPLSIVPCQGLAMAALGLCANWDSAEGPAARAEPSAEGPAARAEPSAEGPAAAAAPAWLTWLMVAMLAASLGLQWRECQSSACLNRGSALAGQPGALALQQQLLAQAAALRPEDLRAWTRLGRACLDGQQAAAGEAAYAKAAQLLPHLGEAWTGLALAQGMQGKLPQAEESGVRAVGLNPRAQEAWSNLAKVRYLRGEKDLAVATAQQGLLQADESAGAWYNLAAMLMDQRRFHEAVPALNAVLRLDPSQAQARKMLELCLHAP
ncbi:MAG TPA: O-antigen ligase family protein [bacterium]|nr:O-antigen ligase family protein [bacterium]